VRERLELWYWFVLFLVSLGLALSHPSPEGANPSPATPQQPHSGWRSAGHCFWLVTGRFDPRACRPFGGAKRVRWERECQPDPSCTLLPDGTNYAVP
jgi:hypothetical protein